MAAIVGDFRDACMGNYGKKILERSYLGQERRYQALTHRYNYNVSKGTPIKRDFENHLKITFTYSFYYPNNH